MVSNNNVYPVTFLVNTGSPFTSMIEEAALFLPVSTKGKSHLSLGAPREGKIFGHDIDIYHSPMGPHSNVNILGTDVLWTLDLVFAISSGKVYCIIIMYI